MLSPPRDVFDPGIDGWLSETNPVVLTQKVDFETFLRWIEHLSRTEFEIAAGVQSSGLAERVWLGPLAMPVAQALRNALESHDLTARVHRGRVQIGLREPP